MKRCVCLLAIALVWLSAPGLAQQQDGEIVRSDFLGLELTLAPDWYRSVPGSTDDRLLLASRDSPEDQAVMLVSLLPGQGRTLESFATTTRNFVFTRMDGFIESEEHLEVDGAESYLMIYQGMSKVDGNGWRMFYRVVSEKDGDFLVFHGVFNKEDFSRHKGSFENMIKSLSWIVSDS